jgi:transcriptional regulator with XRE-family HTH domain
MTTLTAPVLNVLEIRQGLALSQERLGAVLRVSPKTVSRWEDKAGQPADEALLHKLSQLKEIAELGSRVYTPQGLKLFLTTPLPVFGGRSGLELMSLGEFEPVIAALAADFEGLGY